MKGAYTWSMRSRSIDIVVKVRDNGDVLARGLPPTGKLHLAMAAGRPPVAKVDTPRPHFPPRRTWARCNGAQEEVLR